MGLRFKKNIEKLVDFSVESQFKREDRLRGHVSSFFAASSIVLVAETTLFTVLSITFYDICSFLWYVSIALLVLQIVLIVVCYIVLFPSLRINILSPNKIYGWYKNNYNELESDQDKSGDDNGIEITEMNMLKEEANMYDKIYESVKKDVDAGFVKLRVIQIISIVLVGLFSHITLIMCFLKLFK